MNQSCSILLHSAPSQFIRHPGLVDSSPTISTVLRLQIDLQSRPDGKHPKLEKYLLRKAFDVPDAPYLPESVLFRQKEQFSDGVGYSWVDALKDYANEVRFGDVHH